jgi:hypothetical protein
MPAVHTPVGDKNLSEKAYRAFPRRAIRFARGDQMIGSMLFTPPIWTVLRPFRVPAATSPAKRTTLTSRETVPSRTTGSGLDDGNAR